jgi:DNA primase
MENGWDEVIQEALSYFDNSYHPPIQLTQSEEIFDLDTISFPVSKELTPIAYDYLKSRNISDSEIEEYQIRVGKSYQLNNKRVKKWKGRILFPFFENNQVIYIVGRTYTNQEPKYLNSKGSRRDKLFPSRTFKTSEIIVCEGIFDAINAKRTTNIFSVATLGKEITEEQVNIIAGNGAKTVYLALDPDLTIREWQKSIMKFLVKGCRVYPVLLPQGNDVDSVGNKFPYYLEESIKKDLASTFLFQPDFLSSITLF